MSLENNTLTIEMGLLVHDISDRNGETIRKGCIVNVDNMHDDTNGEVCNIFRRNNSIQVVYRNFRSNDVWDSYADQCSVHCIERINGDCIRSIIEPPEKVTITKSVIVGLCAECINSCKVNKKEECGFHENRK